MSASYIPPSNGSHEVYSRQFSLLQKPIQLYINVKMFIQYSTSLLEFPEGHHLFPTCLKELHVYANLIRVIQDQILDVIESTPILQDVLGGDTGFNITLQKVNTFAVKNGLSPLKIETHRLQRFRKVVNEVNSKITFLPDRALIKPIIRAKLQPLKWHWLEKKPIKIVDKDKILLEGHIYPFKGSKLQGYIDQWDKILKSRMTFEEYLNSEQCIKTFLQYPAILEDFKKGMVSYYKIDSKELKTFATKFDNGRIRMALPHFPKWLQMATLSRGKYQEFLDKYINSPKKFDASEESKRSRIHQPGGYKLPKSFENEYIFILDRYEQFYVSLKVRGELHHTSMSDGHSVLGGGTLKVDEDGKIIYLTNWSGHYQFDPNTMVEILRYLKSKGVDIDKIRDVSLGTYDEKEKEIVYVSLTGTGLPSLNEWMKTRIKVTSSIKMLENLLANAPNIANSKENKGVIDTRDHDVVAIKKLAGNLEIIQKNYGYDSIMSKQITEVLGKKDTIFKSYVR